MPNVVRTAKSHSNISSCLGRGGDGGQESEGDLANIKSNRRGREEMEPREESGNQIMQKKVGKNDTHASETRAAMHILVED